MFFAVLGLGLGLVEALQRTVVPLIESPVAVHRDPQPVGDVERQVRGGDRTAQQRGVDHVGLTIASGDEFAGPPRLGAALVSQVDIDPAGELIACIPLALAVA